MQTNSVHLPVVAGICSHREADLSPDAAELLHTGQIANDDIRSRFACRPGIITIAVRRLKIVISIGCIAAPMEIFPTTGQRRTVGRERWQTLLKSAVVHL